MQSPHLSLISILEALNLDRTYLPLLEQASVLDEGTHSGTPQAVFAAIRTIGSLLNVQQQADELAENLEERIDLIIHKLKFIAAESKPTVLVLHEMVPVRIVQNEYLTSLIHIAGGVNYADTAVDPFNPDIIIIINDKPIPQLLDELPGIFSMPEWSQVAAATNNNVHIIHHSGYLRQPGALIAEDAEILAEIIHPKQFIFGRDQDVWMKFEWR
ncbi:ABC transporter substrate-binding protein [Parapedobacter sp. DT-150]|uniref:ABC transporter substrate-binding protein n=1 Tax=Parapedobacter sp. DT-150 TaxID=3396162 RepID=UPI003F1A479C